MESVKVDPKLRWPDQKAIDAAWEEYMRKLEACL